MMLNKEASEEFHKIVSRLCLLENHFPESIHPDILNAVGLTLGVDKAAAKKRDPQFRQRVLTAYEYRCAVCGFDVRLGSVSIALDAAHIRWFQAGGPDEEAGRRSVGRMAGAVGGGAGGQPAAAGPGPAAGRVAPARGCGCCAASPGWRTA